MPAGYIPTNQPHRSRSFRVPVSLDAKLKKRVEEFADIGIKVSVSVLVVIAIRNYLLRETTARPGSVGLTITFDPTTSSTTDP